MLEVIEKLSSVIHYVQWQLCNFNIHLKFWLLKMIFICLNFSIVSAYHFKVSDIQDNNYAIRNFDEVMCTVFMSTKCYKVLDLIEREKKNSFYSQWCKKYILISLFCNTGVIYRLIQKKLYKWLYFSYINLILSVRWYEKFLTDTFKKKKYK